MRLGLTHRQTTRVEADDLIVRRRQSGHALGDQPLFERAGAVAWDGRGQRAVLGQNGLRTVAAAGVATLTATAVLLVTKVIRQFSGKRPFQQRLLQVAEQAALTQKVGEGCGSPPATRPAVRRESSPSWSPLWLEEAAEFSLHNGSDTLPQNGNAATTALRSTG